MNKFAFSLLVLIFLVLLIPHSFAQKNSIKLLAVEDKTREGAVVDLDLTITDGSGKVFIETYPLSQIDTQISLRVAKIIACKLSEKYCPGKDFVYSLKAESPVVAGPSAGAAMALLTLASLDDKKLDENTVITGTINSGGVIGAVGGIKEKIKAAAGEGMKKVLIPKGEENSSSIASYGKSFNITVKEVSNIEEAYEIFTGEKINYPRLSIDNNYKEIMKRLNTEVCRRTEGIKNKLEKDELEKINVDDSISKNKKIKEAGLNLSREAEKLFIKGLYYSSASRCFGANVFLREALMREMNLSLEEIEDEVENVKKSLTELEIEINSTKITNLGDLEAVMIIRERLYDAKENLNKINMTDPIKELSYAAERAYSAKTWKKFIGFPGKEIDEEKLKESCIMKVNEVDELYNYVAIYFPSLLQETKKELNDAKKYFDTGDYILCLFKASKSEAEINTALSALYMKDDRIDVLLENKILAAKKEVQRQIKKGTFPILGYSYYEYANALDESDKYIRLLYAEYGIELSNLDIYFPAKKPFGLKIDEKALLTLILGFIIGISLFFARKKYRRKKIILKRK